MIFGILMGICWPLLFGTDLSRQDGRVGMWLGLVVIALLTYLVLKRWPGRYVILANGLVALGLFSLIPIIPFLLGALVMTLLGTVNALMGFSNSLAVTLTYALCYLVLALIAGCLVRDIRQMRRSTDPTMR